MRGLQTALAGAAVLMIGGAAEAQVYEHGNWDYACPKDHLDPYGEVRNPRHCWASVTSGDVRLSVFHFDKDGRETLTRIEGDEACGYGPSRIAVDGRRIDLLPDEEQIQAVLRGSSMTREVWERRWPYCSFRDQTVSLRGSTEIYNRLVKLKPTMHRK